MRSASRLLMVMLSGILMSLSFPTTNFYWLAWIGLVPFFWVLKKCENWKQAAFYGFVFGLVFFGVVYFWLTALYRFVGVWIALGYLSAVIFQSLYVIGFALSFYAVRNLSVRWAAVPFVWVIWEWLRAAGPFGSTFGGIGYSQAALLPLIQICSFTTVYGISFLLAMSGAALAEAAEKKKIITLFLPVSLVILCVIYGYWYLGQSQPVSEVIRLSIIQPNIDQMQKMDARNKMVNYEIQERLTLSIIKDDPQIIVWPETAIFSYLLRDQAMWQKVRGMVLEAKAWFIIGIPHYEKGNIYNSVVAISPSAEAAARYDKQRLVPFGEYLPFRPLLFPLLKGVGYYDQEFNSNPRPVNLSAGDLRIATVVCFESTFPDTVRQRVKPGADLILTLTNDSWFGDSAAAYSHLNAGIFRAIENRRYFIQAANTGISAVIDPCGRMIGRAGMNEEKALTVEVPLP